MAPNERGQGWIGNDLYSSAEAGNVEDGEILLDKLGAGGSSGSLDATGGSEFPGAVESDEDEVTPPPYIGVPRLLNALCE